MEERQRSARVRAELMAATQRRESQQAQKLIDEFVRQVGEAGLPPVGLKARTTSGQVVRTNVRGWYIKADHSVAVGVDGGYYSLTVFGGLVTKLRGVSLQPSPPPLIVGHGGKDGESGDLKDFLGRALSGGV